MKLIHKISFSSKKSVILNIFRIYSTTDSAIPDFLLCNSSSSSSSSSSGRGSRAVCRSVFTISLQSDKHEECNNCERNIYALSSNLQIVLAS